MRKRTARVRARSFPGWLGLRANPRRRIQAKTAGQTTVKMGEEGLELSRFPAGKSGVSESGGSKSGNKDAPFGDSAVKPTDPELAAVVAAWPTLPLPIRTAILAMLDTIREAEL